MSTERILRQLTEEKKDPAAMLALYRSALRENDTLLLDFVKETVKIRLLELDREKGYWEDIVRPEWVGYSGPGFGPSLILFKTGEKRIQVIKSIRALTGLGLRESKELVDQAPSVVIRDLPSSLALSAIQEMGKSGATVLWDDPQKVKKDFPLLWQGGSVNSLHLRDGVPSVEFPPEKGISSVTLYVPGARSPATKRE